MNDAAVSEEAHATGLERRHFTHKRMDRWIRLQQFVFGLPDDYSYAICTSALPNAKFRSRTLVRVGWMSWYGDGRGSDRQHSLAVSLLGTSEALSGNSTLVFWHSVTKLARLRMRSLFCGKSKVKAPAVQPGEQELELLAG